MKIVFISTMLPSGHYSQILTEKLSKISDIELIIYSDDQADNLKINNCGKIKTVWRKGIKFGWQIIKELKKDKPDVVHLQHEFNMYGGLVTAGLFPFLVVALRFMGIPVVVTIHSVVSKTQIDHDFISLFNVKPILAKPILFKMVFGLIYILVTKFGNKIIVHTDIMKDILISDYHANRKKIQTINTAIPECKRIKQTPENYFFYFGYMVKRKGLSYVLDGFDKFIKKFPNSDFQLVMAGGAIKGQEKSLDEILQEISDRNLKDRVKYVGFIDQDKQDELYNNAYIVVLPAKISIAASGPLYYSFGYRKCPLASKIGNLKEEIKDGKTGILVSNSEWDKAFEYAIKNKNIITEIEHNIEKEALKRSPNNVAKKYTEVYLEVARH